MALLLFCLSLSSCSGQNNDSQLPWQGIQTGTKDLSAITDRTEYYDITAEQEPIFQWEPKGENSPLAERRSSFISMQFYQGEPVQFWGIETIRGQFMFWDLYLYRLDGSRELLLQDISMKSRCYLDQDGNLYLWKNSFETIYEDGSTETTETILQKYSPSRELLYEQQFEYGYNIQEIRQTADDKVYLFTSSNGADEQNSRKLAELKPSTGVVTELGAVSLSKELSQPDLGTWGKKLVTLKYQQLYGNEITAINVKNGKETCVLSFQGTTYLLPSDLYLQEFRVLEDESVEILWTSADGSSSLRERLRMEKVERTPIVLRGQDVTGWLAKQINAFNRQNKTYHVIVEDCGYGNDMEDFARLTSVQIASGKGPDILYGGLMQDYISGMIKNGLLEDLRPHMEKSGMQEENYFPFTFAAWRDGEKICGISPATPSLSSYRMDSAVLGGMQEPDIQTLVDVLLARQEDAVFLKTHDSQMLLEFLLEGSDTLWGMVDWEKGSCDFNGELFAQILETAKRYGKSENKRDLTPIAEGRSFIDIYVYDEKEEREKKGKTICGVLFDDGCHVAVNSYSALAINTNSSNKEGAWEFLSFLLGDEAQSASNIPAARSNFAAWVEKQKETFANGKKVDMMYGERLADGSIKPTGRVIYTAADVTDEIIEEYTEALEDARPCPLRTIPILDIISEEAADYFSGSKSAADVAKLVTNRVQTYLDEGY